MCALIFQILKFSCAYSKLRVLMLALTIARMWPDVFPMPLTLVGYTLKMGRAPDDLGKRFKTQVWLCCK